MNAWMDGTGLRGSLSVALVKRLRKWKTGVDKPIAVEDSFTRPALHAQDKVG